MTALVRQFQKFIIINIAGMFWGSARKILMEFTGNLP